ncbi:hypothetical protein, partial [Klebsiella pneumoniae]
ENAGVGQAVCAAAEWDSEKVNVLPHYNPALNKVIIAGHLARIVYDPNIGASLRT